MKPCVVFANILSKSKETSDYRGHRCAAVSEAGTVTDKINMIQTQDDLVFSSQ